MTWNLVKHEFDRPQTAEERELGLDPSKYTRNPWRPQGGAPARPQTPQAMPSPTPDRDPEGWELLKEREERMNDDNRRSLRNMIDGLGFSEMTAGEAMKRIQMLKEQLQKQKELEMLQAEQLGLQGALSDRERQMIQQQMMMRLGGY